MYTPAELLVIIKDRLPDLPEAGQREFAEAMADFSAEVAAKEREACARIAIDYAIAAGDGSLEAHAAERVARIIRSRGAP